MLNVSHIVNSVYTSRTYILSEDGGREFWIVDCGDVPPLVDLISSLGGGSFKIKGVLLTHVHYDHIYGLPRLKEMFPEVRVYTNEIGRVALGNEKLNYSKYHNDPIAYESENIVVCKEGDEIELFGGVTAKVHETPGHSDSCLTYEMGDYLFTGDAYIPGVKVVTTLKGGDKNLAAKSVERIKSLAEGKIICPGHEVM
jgi:glyoxylase-like metal-dependent hydrolase (beta-lactamase superfamily II)